MPKCFRFHHGTQHFHCKLDSEQCEADSKSGRPCRNRVVIGLPYCHVHTKQLLKLKIQDSDIHGAGKGIFAYSGTQAGRVFSRNQVICDYEGEVLTLQEVSDRYGDTDETVAPYTIQLSPHRALDAACRRGIAGVINHSDDPNVKFYRYRDRIRVKALKNINHGTELKVNYGPDYEIQDNHSTYNCR